MEHADQTSGDSTLRRHEEQSIAILSLGSSPRTLDDTPRMSLGQSDNIRTALLDPNISIHHFLGNNKRWNVSRRALLSVSFLVLLSLLFAGFRFFSATRKPEIVNYTGEANVTFPGSFELMTGPSSLVQLFEKFVLDYNKSYESMEERFKRLGIFALNLVYIEKHNAGSHSYKLAPNEFTDLSFDEFKALKLHAPRRAREFSAGEMYRTRALQQSDEDDQDDDSDMMEPLNEGHVDWDLLSVDESGLPKSVDWRDRGCVTSVKDQRSCGSCWAFSAAGAVEAAYCKKYGSERLESLSVQQMVDCGFPEGNAGCDGGEMDEAFQYVMDQGGLCAWEDYPYLAKDGECHDTACRHLARVARFADVPHGSERALRAAIALRSPCSVGIEAGQLAFQFYRSGVFDAPCGTALDHGVLVVGYGVDRDSGKDFWLIKNSWGDKWGEDGYVRLTRQTNASRVGECGVLMEPSYPIIL